MLMLSRYEGEKIFIGDEVIVLVSKVQDKGKGQYQVQLGVTAPRYVPVDRLEVQQSKAAEMGDMYRPMRLAQYHKLKKEFEGE